MMFGDTLSPEQTARRRHALVGAIMDHLPSASYSDAKRVIRMLHLSGTERESA